MASGSDFSTITAAGNSEKIIISFGEVLWDCFPSGRCLGGAPLNVAYHLKQLGKDALLLSAVGDDAAGKAVLSAMTGMGLRHEGVSIHSEWATGTVQVTLDAAGDASYQITESVAWDRILWDRAHVLKEQNVAAIVYGSLAARNAHNLKTLKGLLNEFDCLKVFDVNLRAPHDSLELVAELAHFADVLKLNEEELFVLCGAGFDSKKEFEGGLKSIAKRFEIERICLTRGAQGALFYEAGSLFFADSIVTDVEDTVGAGDAFTALMVAGLLHAAPTQALLNDACSLAGYVASQKGATPHYQCEGAPGKGDFKILS